MLYTSAMHPIFYEVLAFSLLLKFKNSEAYLLEERLGPYLTVAAVSTEEKIMDQF